MVVAPRWRRVRPAAGVCCAPSALPATQAPTVVPPPPPPVRLSPPPDPPPLSVVCPSTPPLHPPQHRLAGFHQCAGSQSATHGRVRRECLLLRLFLLSPSLCAVGAKTARPLPPRAPSLLLEQHWLYCSLQSAGATLVWLYIQYIPTGGAPLASVGGARREPSAQIVAGGAHGCVAAADRPRTGGGMDMGWAPRTAARRLPARACRARRPAVCPRGGTSPRASRPRGSGAKPLPSSPRSPSPPPPPPWQAAVLVAGHRARGGHADARPGPFFPMGQRPPFACGRGVV